MRTIRRKRVLGAVLVAFALLAAACGDDEGGPGGDTIPDGPTISVASFNFPESVILAEIYAQALESAGYPVDRKLNLGAREVIFPSIENGEIDLLPEYLGSSLGVGFGVSEGPSDSDSVAAALAEEFDAFDVEVLDYAPGEDKNVFVVTQAFADEHDLATISDLQGVADLTLGGPPECEGRDTCFLGLTQTYGLGQLQFQSLQEGAARIAALENGEIDIALLFSTQPVIKEKGFVALEDDQGIIRAENIVPVLNRDIIDAYGQDIVDLIDSITAEITTDVLLDLNGRVELDNEDPDDVARAWLEENDFV